MIAVYERRWLVVTVGARCNVPVLSSQGVGCAVRLTENKVRVVQMEQEAAFGGKGQGRVSVHAAGQRRLSRMKLATSCDENRYDRMAGHMAATTRNGILQETRPSHRGKQRGKILGGRDRGNIAAAITPHVFGGPVARVPITRADPITGRTECAHSLEGRCSNA